MGCENSRIAEDGSDSSPSSAGRTPRPSTRRLQQSPSQATDAARAYRASQAFVVSVNENNEAEMVAYKEPSAGGAAGTPTPHTPPTVSKPPKRLQALIEQKANSGEQALRLQDLEDKLHKAEQRRQEFLKQKLTATPKFAGSSNGGGDEVDESGERAESAGRTQDKERGRARDKDRDKEREKQKSFQ